MEQCNLEHAAQFKARINGAKAPSSLKKSHFSCQVGAARQRKLHCGFAFVALTWISFRSCPCTGSLIVGHSADETIGFRTLNCCFDTLLRVLPDYFILSRLQVSGDHFFDPQLTQNLKAAFFSETSIYMLKVPYFFGPGCTHVLPRKTAYHRVRV